MLPFFIGNMMEHDGKKHMVVRENYPFFQVLKVFEDVDPHWNMIDWDVKVDS